MATARDETALTEQLAKLCVWTGLAGFSLGLFLWQVLHRDRLESVLLKNQLDGADQHRILLWILGSIVALGAGLVVVLALLHRRGAHLSKTQLPVRRALQVSLVLFLSPVLFMKSPWVREPLMMMFLLALVLFYFYFVSSRVFTPEPPRILSKTGSTPRQAWYVALTLMVLGYAGYFSYFTILKHDQLLTRVFDLDIVGNAFFQTLHGDFLRVSHYGDLSLFSHHFSPIYALWYPFYHFWPTPETLLTVQSAFVALSAVPLFLFARMLLRSYPAASLITFCYLIHPGNHGPNFYDVHEMASWPIAVLALFYFLEKRHRVGYFIALVLALAVKEDIGLCMLPIAAFIAIHKRQFRLAAITAAISVAWYIGAQQVIALSGGGQESSTIYAFYYDKLIIDGAEGASGVLKTLLTNPFFALTTVFQKQKLVFVLQMCLPLLFLPLFRRRYGWLLIYGAGVTLLATRPYLYRIAFQYTWYTLPLLFVAAVYVLAEFRQSESAGVSSLSGDSEGRRAVPHRVHPNYRALLATMLLAGFVMSWQYGAVFHPKGFVGGFDTVDFELDDQEQDRLEDLRAMIREIPPTAKVGGSERLIPHVPVKERHSMMRTRYPDVDYLLVFVPSMHILQRQRPEYMEQYVEIRRGHGIVLMKRRTP